MTLGGVVKSAEMCLPVAGVEVRALDSHGEVRARTSTDAEGRWQLTVSETVAACEFSKIDFVTKTVPAERLSDCVRLLEDRLIGYQERFSARPGETVAVHVQAPTAYRATLYRHGQAWEHILDLGSRPPQAQQVPNSPFVAEGLSWQQSFSYRIPATARPGLYSLLLEAAGQDDFAIPLIVSTPPALQGRRAKLLVLACTNDWLAYNFWGGRSLYCNSEVTPFVAERPFVPSWRFHLKEQLKRLVGPTLKRGLRKLLGKPDPDSAPSWRFERLSLRRPCTSVALESDDPHRPFCNHLAAAEWRLLAWLEREGYDHDIVSGYELHCRPELLGKYRALILNTHAEYWSKEMYQGLRRFHEEQGGWVLNLSGNSIYREVDFFDDGSHRCASLSFAASCADETQLLGVRLTPNDYSSCAPYRVCEPGHWAFAGIPMQRNQRFGTRSLNRSMPQDGPIRSAGVYHLDGCGASGWETDKRSKTAPRDVIVVAKGMNRFGGADMVVRDPAATRGGMFSASSVVFSGCLLIDPFASHMVGNVLRRALGKTHVGSLLAS
jgi:hypothetical protein